MFTFDYYPVIESNRRRTVRNNEKPAKYRNIQVAQNNIKPINLFYA